MWKTFEHNDNLYMIKLVQDENLNLYLTDLQNIWVQTITKDALLHHFKECNPLFNIKIEDVALEVSELVNHISSNENIEIIQLDHDQLQLNVKYLKSEFKIQFRFSFNKAPPDIFVKEVTVPLIQTVKHLETCKNMLSSLVQKKDRELEEYKLEKGLISREDLITEKFNEGTLDSIDDQSMLNVFGQSESFWNSFTRKYGNIEMKIEEVKKDPWNHIKGKRKVYSSKTALKRGKGISYDKHE